MVDDKNMVDEVGKAMLKKLGHRVAVAKDGKKAVDIVYKAQANIDLTIFDLIMRGLDSGETFDIIRKKYPNIPV